MMELIHESDRVAAQGRARVVGHARRRLEIDKDFAGIGAFKKSGDMQKRRFAHAGLRDERDGLPRKQRETRAIKHGQRARALFIVARDLFELKNGSRHVTRSAALRPDRAARRARTDRSSQEVKERSHTDNHDDIMGVDDRRKPRKKIKLRRKEIRVQKPVQELADQFDILGND